MPLSGMAAGAANALEQILTRQMLEAQQAARQREDDARLAMEQQRLNETLRQNEIANTRQQRQDDERAADRRQRDNVIGTRRMIGDFLTQRQGPLSPDDARSIAALQIEAGESPNLSALMPKAPERDPIADYEAKKQIDVKYREPNAASTPSQEWVIRNGTPTPIRKGTAQPGDLPYDAVAARQTQGAGTNPQKAAEVRQKIYEAAMALKKAPGLSSMTGTRLNPQHGFGVFSDPIAGTSAADAKAQYDSLVSLMTLENLGYLKGAMSDKDIEFIKAASSALKPSMRDDTFMSELQKIIDKTGGVSVDAPAPNAGTSPSELVYDPVTKTLKPKGGQ